MLSMLLEHPARIELVQPAWEASVLPLNYGCVLINYITVTYIKKIHFLKWTNILFGGPDRDRTGYLFHAMEALSQVSYRPKDKDNFIEMIPKGQHFINKKTPHL